MTNDGGSLAAQTATAIPLLAATQPLLGTLRTGALRVAAAPDAQGGVFQRTIRYGYDDLNRLTSAQESGSTTNTLTYAYDRTGNRTDGGRTYDAANQVSGWTYDNAGNLTNDGTTSYAYDALHRQVGTTTGGQTTTYDLTGAGLLRTRNDGPSYTDYGYDLAQPLPPVIFSNQLNGPQNRFISAGDDLLARLPIRPVDLAHWVGVDGLGSVRQDLDRSGAPQALTHYDPWGRVQAGPITTLGFTGELHDPANGLVNLRVRWGCISSWG